LEGVERWAAGGESFEVAGGEGLWEWVWTVTLDASMPTDVPFIDKSVEQFLSTALQMQWLELERRSMAMLLEGDDPVLDKLRAQWRSASVVQRRFSGCGFFTDFTVPDQISRVQPPSFEIGDISLTMAGVDFGIILFIRAGAIDWLEGFTYGTFNWPEDDPIDQLQFINFETGSKGTRNPGYIQKVLNRVNG
jgi:hypothetical protein